MTLDIGPGLERVLVIAIASIPGTAAAYYAFRAKVVADLTHTAVNSTAKKLADEKVVTDAKMLQQAEKIATLEAEKKLWQSRPEKP